jgi:hypothetical protein
MNDDTDATVLWEFVKLLRSGAAKLEDLPEEVQASVERIEKSTRYLLAHGLESTLAQRKAEALKRNGHWKE